MEQVRTLEPSLTRAALVYGVPAGYAQFAEALSVQSVHLGKDFLPPALVEDAHRRGLDVWVYTVNETEDIARMRELGVDGVFTDFPDRVVV